MMRGLYSGVQGLRAHQVRMDVIGNNIANVNTTAFKASRVNFADTFSQTVSGGARSSAVSGGINAQQIGLGVGVSSIDIMTGGTSYQQTGKSTDLAIAGEGFFVVKDGARFLYTRAGTFDFDSLGFLVNPANGQKVQGWIPDATGIFPPRAVSEMTDIKLPIGDTAQAKATTRVVFDQQLNARTPEVLLTDPASATAAFTVIDSLGEEHSITIRLWKTQEGTNVTDAQWTYQTFNGTDFLGGGVLTFDQSGAITNVPQIHQISNFDPGNGANAMDFDLDFTKVTQPALESAETPSTFRMLDYDGFTSGVLTNIMIDNRGVITGFYSNGDFREIGQVAVAYFSNPGGLTREAGNAWGESTNSGLALIGEAGTSGRGLITSSTLEMSNVDLSAEFTNLIVTQRGFQANSRIITTSDELLQEIVNLKR